MNELDPPWLNGLPLTPFERYLVADDRPNYPMTFPVNWTVVGDVDTAAFQRAYQDAIRWHPLLRSCVRERTWRPCDAAVGPVGVFEHGLQPQAADRVIDLVNGPTVRFNLIIQADRAVIELLVHHAATDGVAATEFCGDVFSRYAELTGKASGPQRTPVIDQLRHRSTLDRRIPHPVSRATVAKTLILEGFTFLTRRAEPIGTAGLADGSAEHWQVVDQQFDRDLTCRVQAAADAAGATTNDWVITALMRTVADFNDRRNNRSRWPLSRNRWIIANMPVFMRPWASRRTPATNMIGYAFLARQRATLRDWDSSLASIAADRIMIQRWKLGGLFLDGLRTASRVPGLLWLSTHSWLRPASFVISNVGDPARRFRHRFPTDDEGRPLVGNLTLVKLIGAAPTRPGTHLAGLVNSLGGRLSFSLRVSPTALSAADASELLDGWIQEMLRHA